MRKLYLIGIIIIFLLLLILVLPQVGAICTWYPPLTTGSLPIFPLFQAASLGAIIGGLFVLFWKTPKEGEGDDEEN